MDFFGNEDQANKNIFIDLDFTTVKCNLHYGISLLNRMLYLAFLVESQNTLPS